MNRMLALAVSAFVLASVLTGAEVETPPTGRTATMFSLVDFAKQWVADGRDEKKFNAFLDEKLSVLSSEELGRTARVAWALTYPENADQEAENKPVAMALWTCVRLLAQRPGLQSKSELESLRPLYSDGGDGRVLRQALEAQAKAK